MIKRLLIILVILSGQLIVFYQVSGVIWKDKLIEMESKLSELSFEEKSDSVVNITGKLKLIEKRLQRGESSVENYEYEARIQSLTSGMELYVTPPLKEEAEESSLARIVRFAMGKTSPLPAEEPPYFAILEEAYFWERNRHYEIAVLKYNELLDGYRSELRESMLHTILLHQSFSHLMRADYSEAVRLAEELIDRSSNIVYRATADKIVSFIDSVKERGEKLALLEEESLELGRELYFSVRYEEAIYTLEQYLADPESPEKESEARYYKGRALEELGRISESIREYQRIRIVAADDNLIRESGRRMVMLQSFYDITESENEKLDESLLGFEDPELENIINPFEALYIEPESMPEAPILSDSKDNGDESARISATGDVEYGEIYITTIPSGARISVNNVYFGISPIFVTSLPLGTAVVNADYEEMSGKAEVQVSSKSIRRLDMRLQRPEPEKAIEEVTGFLKINHDLTEISFMLDYEEFDYEPGETKELPEGEYILIADGKDISNQLLYWEGVISITKDSITEITIP